MAAQEGDGKRRNGRLLAFVYGLGLLHVLVLFKLGEPYPSLQGPMFAGHLQQGETIYVPFYREDRDAPRLPSHEKLLRHETLAIPIQEDAAALAPTLPGPPARQFLIGHSLRTPFLNQRRGEEFKGVNWSTYKYHAPRNAPPRFEGEVDLLHD